jgi:hypothetical protein
LTTGKRSKRQMKRPRAVTILTLFVALAAGCVSAPMEEDGGWISLFDGKSFDGWKVSENPHTFTIRDGAIVANGPRAHCFYVGPVENADFKNFELKVDVMTKPNSNGGIFFHTEYQDEGWPAKGFEAQVNNTYMDDPRKTGSLYGIVDVLEAPAKDNVWFTEHVIVKSKRVVIKVDGKTVVDWTEPAGERARRALSSGTVALQGHDPGSTVFYKNIRIKPLRAD